MARPLRFEDVVRLLRGHDSRFFVEFGRGSHRLICRINDEERIVKFAMPYHKGKTVGVGLLLALCRHFDVPKDLFS